MQSWVMKIRTMLRTMAMITKLTTTITSNKVAEAVMTTAMIAWIGI